MTLEPKAMFSTIIADIKKYPLDKINVSVDSDSGTIILLTKYYRLEIIVYGNMIRYDFSLDKSLTAGVPQGVFESDDINTFEYGADYVNGIFNGIRLIVKSLLTDSLYYGVFDGNAVFARPNKDGQYRVTFVPTKRRFFVSIKQETWSNDKVMNDARLTRLDARS